MPEGQKKLAWPRVPDSDALQAIITQYVTHPIETEELKSMFIRETLITKGEGQVSWNTTAFRIMGSNCGVRDFGSLAKWGVKSGEIARKILGLIGWLPMCTNPRNYPYVKVTSFTQNTFQCYASNEEEEKELREWGWTWRKLRAAAHPFQENYYMYYMFFRMPQKDVYALRGIENNNTERTKQIVRLREWIDSISKNNKINWK